MAAVNPNMSLTLSLLTFTTISGAWNAPPVVGLSSFIVVSRFTLTHHITVKGAGLYLLLKFWGKFKNTMFLSQSTALTHNADKAFYSEQ